MLSDFYQTYNSPAIKGEDIVIPSHCQDAIYLSESGEVFCFMGICRRDNERVHFRGWPYYLDGKHSSKCQKQIRGFFRIKSGCVLLTQFLDQDYYSDKYYKKLSNYVVRLPVPNSCAFGVEERVETQSSWTFKENEDLTRACFGLTYDELDHIVKVYAELLGLSNSYFRYPKVTRSIKSENFCDITGLWISEGFPYIAFNDSQYAYSHVSLYGFYRHMGALLSMGSHTNGTKIFKQDELTEDIILKIRNIDDYFPIEIRVTKEIIYPDLFV